MKTTAQGFNCYEEAMSFLFQAVDYEKMTRYKYALPDFDLTRMEKLLVQVGSPHNGLKAVHITGTKGKGSTAMMVSEILKGAGLKVGLFTSPHLVHLEERIRVNGQKVSKKGGCHLLGELKSYIEKERCENPALAPTFFEIVTAMALLYFREQKVDLAVIEVGLGGRLDSTNVITPRVSVITSVGFDHTDKLGNTLGKIAWEKAGIIKEGVPAISSPQRKEALEVIEDKCREKGSKLYLVGRDIRILDLKEVFAKGLEFDVETWSRSYTGLFLPLLGAHQAINCACALGAIEALREQGVVDVSVDGVRKSLLGFRCPARVEVVCKRPFVILDSAHTLESIKALKKAIEKNFNYKRLILVLGISRDKDVEGILKEIVPVADEVIFTGANPYRSASPQFLKERAKELCGKEALMVVDAWQAFKKAKELAGKEDLVCVTGSFFLAGKVKEILEGK